ncbi:MAG: hypothetical protein HKN01_05160, partial [Acidimicrobiia bacterium]|nr:hypothetical protein [Acidimicrobiia bacterium]
MSAAHIASSDALMDIVGRGYGPVSGLVAPGRVAAYVAATGDDADRWRDQAPPSLAGALLFEVAPMFLADPDVVPHTTTVVHADQTFSWHRPIPIGAAYEVEGSVARVRERSGTFWVTFESTVTMAGSVAIESTSTFLLSDAALAAPADEEAEPALTARAESGYSASRLDLVSYAAASGDVNPIHWDHDSAVAAGLPGVIVHGLLTNAWIIRHVIAATDGGHPLAALKTRFRSPIRPAQQVDISGDPESVSVEC